MKISFNYKAIIAAVTLSVALLSCAKKQDYIVVDVSGLSLIHASPTIEKLDVYVDNTRATISDFGYGSKIDYLNAYSGNRKLTVTKKESGVALKSEFATLTVNKGYSLFVIDKLENIKFLLLEDDLAKPAAGKAKVRFVNLSPDSDPLNLAIDGKPTDLVTNKAFKEYSTFETIDPGNNVKFLVKNKNTGNVETFIADVKIEEGKIYTVYARGLKAATDETKLGVAVFTHK